MRISAYVVCMGIFLFSVPAFSMNKGLLCTYQGLMTKAFCGYEATKVHVLHSKIKRGELHKFEHVKRGCLVKFQMNHEAKNIQLFGEVDRVALITVKDVVVRVAHVTIGGLFASMIQGEGGMLIDSFKKRDFFLVSEACGEKDEFYLVDPKFSFVEAYVTSIIKQIEA